MVGLLVLRSGGAAAQPRAGWQADPLLAPYLVHTLVADPGGALWVGTEEGAFRYDGHALTPLNALRTRGARLPVTPCYAVAVDQRGQTWLSTGAGVYVLTPGGELRQLPRLAPGPAAMSQLVLAPGGGRVWAMQHTRAVGAYDLNGRIRVVIPMPGAAAVELLAASDSSLWVTVQDVETRHYDARGHLLGRWPHPRTMVRPVAATQGRTVLVSSRAAYELRPGGRLAEVLRWLPPGEANSLAVAGRDSGFVVLFKEELFELSLGRRPRLLSRQPVPVAALTRLAIDPAGAWWCFGSRQRGAVRGGAARSFIQRLTPPDGAAVSTRAVARAADGRLIVSSYRHQMEQPADQPTAPLREWPYETENGRPTQPVFYALAPTRPASDTLIGALESGRFAFLNTRTRTTHDAPVLGQAAVPLATALLRDSSTGRLWAGAGTGLYWFDEVGRAFRPYAAPADGGRLPLRDVPLEQLAADRAGRLWLAGSTGLRCLWPATGRVLHYGTTEPPARRLPTDDCLSLWPDPRTGHVWVGTRTHGLLELDPARGVRRVVGAAQGLPHVAVGGLLPGPDRSLWISTYYGLARLDLTTFQLAVFSSADGLSDPPELNRHSAWADAGGALYFGGVGGLHRVDPRRAPVADAAPRLLLTGVVEAADSGRIRALLPPAARTLRLRQLPGEAPPELRVALTDFREPAQRRYSWRLVGVGQAGQWQELGADPRIRVPPGLAPGRYVMVVRATTGRGIPARNGLRVPLSVVPAWWQRWWVRALLGLAAAALLYGLHRLRLQAALREERLRTRLAADLHDEVGSLLARVTMQAELLREIEPEPSAALTELAEDSRLAATTMRDIVWAVDARADTLSALLDRMHDHLDATARAAGWPAATLTLDPALSPEAPLPPLVRQHFYLIFKEAVTNAARHGVGVLWIRVAVGPAPRRRLTLVVEHDGAPVAEQARGGIGLKNMRQRATLLGQELAVGARVGGGWEVRLT